jgi:hypothetical protein
LHHPRRSPPIEARRFFRDLKHSTEHIDTSKFNKTRGKVIDEYEAVSMLTTMVGVFSSRMQKAR